MSGDKCERCKKNPAQEPHTCPLLSEIHDDDESLCTCCEDCEFECEMEI